MDSEKFQPPNTAVDKSELTDLRIQAERRAKEAWLAYKDPVLKEQIAALSEREKQVIDMAVANFISDEMARQKARENSYCNDFVFRSVKPVGGKGDMREHSSNRPIHRSWPQDAFKKMDTEFSDAIDPDFLPYLRLPGDLEMSRDAISIFVQIIPVSDQEVIIRCEGSAWPSNHDSRGSGWCFNMLTFKGAGSIDDFLKHGSGGKLLPFIARNLITAVDPQNAILCDAGVDIARGMQIVDFDELSVTEYRGASKRLSGGKGEKKSFGDKTKFLDALTKQGLKRGYDKAAKRSDPPNDDYLAFFSYDEAPKTPKERFRTLKYDYPSDQKQAFV